MRKRGLNLQILRKAFLPVIIVVLAFLLYFVYSVNVRPILTEKITNFIAKAFFAIFTSLIAFFYKGLLPQALFGILKIFA